MEHLLMGVSLGLGAGLSPGPMTALVVATALQRGARAGAQAACAPLVTDGPILLLSLWVLRTLPETAVAVLALLGGAYLVALGLRVARMPSPQNSTAQEETGLGYLRRAVAVNFLNPSPYLFWSTVGGPAVREAWAKSPLVAASFLVPFFGLLVGTKAALAWGVGAGSRRLTEPLHRRLARVAGGLLAATGLVLAARALQALI